MAALVAASIARRSFSTSYLIPKYSPFSCKSHFYAYLSTKTRPSDIPLFPQQFFIDKYNFSPEIASKVASFSARSKNPDTVLSFLREKGFSNTHLERIIKHHPALLSACLEKTVKPKFKIFQDFGFSEEEAAEVIVRYFRILVRAADTIILSLSVLRRLLGSNGNVIRLIKKWGGLFYVDPEKTLLPNIEFLKSCGVQTEQIHTLIYTLPHLFFLTPVNMRRCVCKADEMGVQRSSRMFIYAVEAVGKMSAETLELKLKSFRDMGFTEDDIFSVFRSAPQVISTSTRKLKEVKEVLLETGKYDMSCIVSNPRSLMCSIEKRYKPRLQVLKDLEGRGLINKWPSLSTLAVMSDKRFFEKFNMKHSSDS